MSAVRKAMGLNNAGIHVLVGRCNSSHQSTNCAIRFNVSANQPSKGRLLGQAMASQLCKRVGKMKSGVYEKVVFTKKWCLRKSGGDEKVVFVVRQCAWCTILFFVGKCEMFHCFVFFRPEMLPGLVKDVAAWDLVDRQSFLQLFHARRHVQFPVHS
jgi:hypothetical protein